MNTKKEVFCEQAVPEDRKATEDYFWSYISRKITLAKG